MSDNTEKTSRIEYLKKQFSKIEDETFNKIVDCDPTIEKKYSSWLLNVFSKSNLSLSELGTAKDALELYNSLKNSIPVHLRDINKFNNLSSFLFNLNQWLIQRFSENEKEMSYLKNGADVIFENEDISILKILSYEGSVKYGSNTSWCTLKTDSFYSYTNQGNLYIVTPKTNKYKKYFGSKSQLHFEKTEFRNNENSAIDLVKIILKNIELFDCFKKISNIKNSTVHKFFYLEECETEEKIDAIKQYGGEMLGFLKDFSLPFINSLFVAFGDSIFKDIPHSENKLISYVSNVENGLKKLIMNGEDEVSSAVFVASVNKYPENILLMNCEDEKLWEDAIIKESWLVSKSPFFKNSEKLLKIILKNFLVIKYVKVLEVFSLEQRKDIAKKLVDDYCENYLNLLKKLGEFDEDFQIILIKKNPECVKYLLNATKKSKDLSSKLIQEKEEKIHKERLKEEKRRRKEEEDNIWGGVIDGYNRSGSWNYNEIIRLVRGNGDRPYYEDIDGRTFRSKEELLHWHEIKRNKYYNNNNEY